MQLRVHIQGHEMLFLVDSGSSTCFNDQARVELLTGKAPLPTPTNVQIAGGALLQATEYFPDLQWIVNGHSFSDCFQILSLNSYDGIIGHDWLAKHSPMITHWSHHWLAVEHTGEYAVLHGEGAPVATHALLELFLVQPAVTASLAPQIPAVQALFDQFSSVFDAPQGLPPRRQYDHQIPLIPGARPVSMRPYRIAPELKTELERKSVNCCNKV
jgi:hypothetical protein